MQIRVSTRDCRVAVGAALLAIEAKIASDKAKFSETSYNALHDGAVHNGLLVNDARKQEMREMVERDVEHAMRTHPGVEIKQVLDNFVDMLTYHRGDDIVIDDQDFNLLKPHLPAGEHPVSNREKLGTAIAEVVGL